MIKKVLNSIWWYSWNLGLFISILTIVPIALDCNELGIPLPGNKPLCKDINSLLSFNKPSETFEKNVRTTCSALFTRYKVFLRKEAEPHLFPIREWISKMRSEIVKTDIGKQMEQTLYKIQIFVVKQWNGLQAWWKEDGQRIFGPAIDGFVMGMKTVLRVILDVVINIAALFLHFCARVKTFSLAWSDGGFDAAMNTLNH
ncbi:hypothetical protein CAEBREN_19405 [Caenorhabditis brenneri]|uniref:Uncharacterized protein n=1 Tax=Caenorhabditis brenneri TaxID=135651 RepID=G0NDE8_CAEBE|nr:hypothetical protein CAEBREN_19405 [Caenorhabditis brenneri]